MRSSILPIVADVAHSDPDLSYIPPDPKPALSRCGEGVALAFGLIAVGLFARQLLRYKKQAADDSIVPCSH